MRAWGIKPDVILNCLMGDFIKTSVSILAPGGVFIELGKRDAKLAGIIDRPVATA